MKKLKSKQTTPAAKTAKAGPSKSTKSMKGCDILVAALEREGVDTIFAYPGGASMEIHQALTRSKRSAPSCPATSRAASSPRKATPAPPARPASAWPPAAPARPTSSPASPTPTWIPCPLVAITGQVPRDMIGEGAFQETDIFGVTLPDREAQLPGHGRRRHPAHREGGLLHRADRPARPGGDRYPEERPDGHGARPSSRRSRPARLQPDPPKADDLALNEIIGLIEKAERPVLYCGGGIITGEAPARSCANSPSARRFR